MVNRNRRLLIQGVTAVIVVNVHWALCWDRMDKGVVNGEVSNCQCLPLSFKGLLSEGSECEGFRHLSPCDLNESLYYPVSNQV